MTVKNGLMRWMLPVMILASGGYTFATEAPEPVPCVIGSRTPEAHTFYGDGAELAQLVSTSGVEVNDRRLYLYTVETNKGAQVVFLERKGDQLEVSRWEGASIGDLKERLNDVMMTNKGVHCIGQASTDLVQAKFNLQPIGTHELPKSAGEIISWGGEPNENDFTRFTLFLLC